LNSCGSCSRVGAETWPTRLSAASLIQSKRSSEAACLPGDIGRMIDRLEHYRRTAFDLFTQLPPELSVEILSYLTVPEVLDKARVRRT
jgi:hypothetical protein